MLKCSVCNRTSENFVIRKNKGFPLCLRHYSQLSRYGKILKETKFDKNEIIILANYAKILLKDKNFKVIGEALIDLKDVDEASKHKWYLRKGKHTNYVVTEKANKIKFLHSMLVKTGKKEVVDHINRNGLDNRRINLRVASFSFNALNQGMHRKNITANKNGSFTSKIQLNRTYFNLGVFETYEEALDCRLQMEKRYYEKPDEIFQELLLKKNLKKAENLKNKYIYKTKRNDFLVEMRLKGKYIGLGSYKTFEEAQQARDDYFKHKGEFKCKQI